jgi:DNA repair protein RecO (recombination protein O)
MQWTEDGIVLGTRRHGETSAIAELMTRGHGRHLGLVRGGAGSRLRPVLQPGNVVSATWRARLDEHLGNYAVEGVRLRAASYLSAPHALYAVTHLAALARLLPERDPHPAVHDALDEVLARLGDPAVAGVLVVRFELQLLTELGFGLDLSCCAATGATGDLVYVSPKSGRAVSRTAGEPWRDRLLALPAFLASSQFDASGVSEAERAEGDLVPHDRADVAAADLSSAFALTGFFLARHLFEPRGLALPDARAPLLAAVLRSFMGARGR